MAEGGYEFENPEFDRDDYADDIDDNLPMVPNEEVQRILTNGNKLIEQLRGELRESELEDRKRRIVKAFYDEISKRYNIVPSDRINYDQFKISDDGKTLIWTVADKEIKITLERKGSSGFKALGTLFICLFLMIH